jgi:hypothetical protein
MPNVHAARLLPVAAGQHDIAAYSTIAADERVWAKHA